MFVVILIMINSLVLFKVMFVVFVFIKLNIYVVIIGSVVNIIKYIVLIIVILNRILVI